MTYRIGGDAVPEIADALGISQVSVTRWETGKREPRVSTLKRIAAVLGCDVTALF